MTVSEILNRLDGIDLYDIATEAIRQTSDQYRELNEEQWQQGKERDDSEIVPTPYSASYAKTRQKEGLQIDHIDFYRTGNFYAGYTLEANGKQVDLSSTVDYEKYLTARYGPEIWGLDPENLDTYRETLIPLMRELVIRELYG